MVWPHDYLIHTSEKILQNFRISIQNIMKFFLQKKFCMSYGAFIKKADRESKNTGVNGG